MSKKLSDSLQTLKYGSGSVSGYLYSDQVCLIDDVCLDNFQFVAITQSDGMEGIDGILGLAPLGSG